MSTVRKFLLASQFWFYLAACPALSQTTEAPDAELAQSREKSLSFAVEMANRYEIVERGSQTAAYFHKQPLLRWNNRVVREDDAVFFLWTNGERGRPVLAAQFFLQGEKWHHEFQSLSDKGLTAVYKSENPWSWNSDRPGIQWIELKDGDRPNSSPVKRLVQMRSIAENYRTTIDLDQQNPGMNREVCRLLSKPLYRYQADDQNVIDGALFVHAQGTNPEMMVLIEAFSEDGSKDPWFRVSFAPMTSFEVEVVRDRERVFFKDHANKVPFDNYFFRWHAETHR